MNPQTYRAQINEAIAPLGVKVRACAHNGGYSYFVDAEGNQVGDSVYVYRQSQLTIEQWEREAQHAVETHAKN